MSENKLEVYCPECAKVVLTFDVLQALDPVYIRSMLALYAGHIIAKHLGEVMFKMYMGDKDVRSCLLGHMTTMTNKIMGQFVPAKPGDTPGQLMPEFPVPNPYPSAN